MCVQATNTFLLHEKIALPVFTTKQKLKCIDTYFNEIMIKMQTASISTLTNTVVEKLETQCCNVFSVLNWKMIDAFAPNLLERITLFLALYSIDIPDLYNKALHQNDAPVPITVADEDGRLKNSIYAYFLHFSLQDIEKVKELHAKSQHLGKDAKAEVLVTVGQDLETLKETLISLLEAYLEIIQYLAFDKVCLIKTYIKLKIACVKCGLFFRDN